MADKKKTTVAPAAEPRKKADVILEKLDCLLSSTTEVINRADKAVASSTYISRQNSEIYERTVEENANIRQQIKYIAAQSQNVYDKMAAMVTALSEKVDQLQRVIDGRGQLTAPQVADEVERRLGVASLGGKPVEIDYGKLAAETVSRIDYERLAEDVVVRFNYEAIVDDIEDLLAEHFALEEDEVEEAPAPAPVEQPPVYEAEEMEEVEDAPYDIDYDVLADKVAERITPASAVPVEIDYDLLAGKVASSLPAQEEVSADYIASKVAEQIIIPDPDYDKIADAVFDKLYEDAEDGGPVEEEYTPDQEEIDQFAAEEEAAGDNFDYEKLATLVAEKLTAADEEETEEEYEPFDYEKLATLVAEKLAPAEEEVSVDEEAEEVVEDVEDIEEEAEEDLIDYEKLAELVAGKITVPEVSEENIAALVAEKLTPAEGEAAEETPAEEAPAEAAAETAEDEIDYEKLASVIAEKISLPEISEESVAALVAEKISMSEFELTVDEDKIAALVAEKLLAAKAEEEPAEQAAEAAEAAPVEEEPAEAPVQLTEETIAQMVDEISKRVCEFLPAEYDIVVDDAGCEELAHAISEKLDKQAIAAGIAEQVIPAIQTDAEEPDYDEIAAKLSEKLTAPEVNEDALAEKAAAVLSNYMPEIDTDEICDRITAAIIAAIPAAESLDYEAVSNSVSEKLIEAQSDSDYDIVIDDEGIAKITDSVAEKVSAMCGERISATEEKLEGFEHSAGERFDKIETDVTEIKDLLLSGAAAGAELAAAEAEQVCEEPEEEIIEEPAEKPAEEPAEEPVEETVEEPAEEPAEEPEKEPEEEPAAEEQPEEELVTVSDVIGGEEEKEPEEEPADEVIDEIVEDIDEQPVDGEVMPDGIEGISSPAVDFANMMKYNRSFIARIIQGSDDVKRYYGATKTALLSYKKVNSSVAWGAERFNKGRETIAKFKIRGKTLCLYLNLNPNDYKTSVYHQVDVSDNKSMATTPMMVKIKSPLGVKKAIRLIDDLLAKRGGVKQNVIERDYVAMYPYETIEELIEDGLVKDVSKNK